MAGADDKRVAEPTPAGKSQASCVQAKPNRVGVPPEKSTRLTMYTKFLYNVHVCIRFRHKLVCNTHMDT